MFAKSAHLYDAIYASRDYEGEARRVHEIVRGRHPAARTLLDVACGTGLHISFLKQYYLAEGLDLDPNLLAIARSRNPDVPFEQSDMASFDLGRRFDVVTCLGAAIAATKTASGLTAALQNMSRHLNPGGLAVVQPWLAPEAFRPGMLDARFVDRPDLKIARMSTGTLENGVSVFDLHYLVGTPESIEYFTEQLELGLFTRERYLSAFRDSALQVEYDPDGLPGAGLYIGVRH
jgi:SAM-dependent methyltransferase